MLEQEYMNTDDQEPPTTKQNQESDSKSMYFENLI